MCYEDGKLMAYLDDEVSADERSAIAQHLAECPDCSARTAALEADREFAGDALGKLQPSAAVVPLEPRRASKRSAAPRRRWGWGQVAAVAAAVLIAGSFAFGPVRNAAASLLQVFRVQQVQTVTVSQADLQSIASALKKGGHVDLKSFGEAWIDGPASKPESMTLAAASSAVDFPVKLPNTVAGSPTIYLQKAQTYRFKLNVGPINQTLETYGVQRTLPAGLDGKVFEIRIPALILAKYPAPAGTAIAGLPQKYDGIYVGQGHSPELVVPDGVDPAQIREVLLDLPFIPQGVRDQLAAVSDWQSTLIIPNIDGTAHDVTINGVKAVVLSPKSAVRDARKKVAGAPPIVDTTTVIWNDNGVVRAVGGPMDEGTAIALAKSTMR